LGAVMLVKRGEEKMRGQAMHRAVSSIKTATP